MSHSSDSHSWYLSLIETRAFQQLIPLVLFFAIPLCVLLLVRNLDTNYLSWSVVMLLENLGLGLPWTWSNGNMSGSMMRSGGERRRGKRKHAGRTREDHTVAMNGNAMHNGDKSEGIDEGYYPGLVNVSGTYCFMNATIQATASLCYLFPHIEAIHAKAEALDVPTPVIDTFRDLLRLLNTPSSYPTPIRPTNLISALSNHSPKQHPATLFSSREHQDAQELFQLLSECIKAETAAVDKEGHRDRGLGGLVPSNNSFKSEIGKSPFDGLTANRRSCVECGYTEAVMHFAFDNWQLAVPRSTASCQLEECLTEYTRLEVLTDCICRKCSMLATYKRLSQEADRLSEIVKADPNVSLSKKKKAKEARRLEIRVKGALEMGRIEDDVKGVKMEKVFSKASTKQAMVARPPQVLALHINRSMHYGLYATKNPIRLIFPEILDLTPFTTSGNLSTVPSIPISTPPPRAATPTPATYAFTRTIYRLSAVVCHYGHHSFGHYVCYRRKPRPVSAGLARFSPPKLGEESKDTKGWLRVSDDSVRECMVEEVLAEGSGAFMLYYEKVMQGRPGLSRRSSEETLKPEMKWGNGSSASIASTSDASVCGSPNGSVCFSERNASRSGGGRTLGPRIVRSVAPSRARSLSAGPPNMELRANGLENGSTPTQANGSAKGKGRSESPYQNGSPIRPLPTSQRPSIPQSSTASPSPSPDPARIPPPQPIEAPQPIHPPAVWT